jgi:hypothetical protein
MTMMFNSSGLDAIRRVDEWLDGECGPEYKAQPLAQTWARVCKELEEGGESIAELILATGQNPRKQGQGSKHQLCSELADRACAAIFAIQHITKSDGETDGYVAWAMNKALGRAREAGY